MRAVGAELVAISPQTQKKNEEMRVKHRIEFPVLSDAGNVYAHRMSLAFKVSEDLRGVYSAFGIALPEYNGDSTWELPLSTRIVVDPSGSIRSIDADADYTHRPEPSETLETLRALSASGGFGVT